MKTVFQKLSSFLGQINWINFALLSLIFSILSFGVLVFSIGFFLDDWPILYSARVHGLYGLQEYYAYDGRPFGYWVNYFFVSLLGFRPLGWHIAALLLRWLSSILMWGTFTTLWPDHKRQVTWAALLFAIYPLFAQQSIAVTFMPHWVCYVLFFLSLYLMVKSFKYRNSTWFWLLTIFSMLFDLVNLFTYENFIGVEFLRPVILWILVSRENPISSNHTFLTRAGLTLRHWAPYILTSFGFIFWRLWLTTQPIGRNTPTVLFNLFQTPFTTLVDLARYAFSDFNQIVFSVWSKTFVPDQLDIVIASDFIAWGLMLSASGIAILYLFHFTKPALSNVSEDQPTEKGKWHLQALLLGALAVIFGAVPGWLVGRTASGSFGLWNDRFGLVSMFGAAIFIVALLDWLLHGSYKKQAAIFCLLLALATNSNFRTANDYKWSSIFQSRFFYMLNWRAPYLESPTAIYSDNEFFSKMGTYPTSFALNLLYPNAQPMPNTNYWFYTITKFFGDNISDLVSGVEITQSHWYARFKTLSTDAIVVQFTQDSSNCLWVLTENDRYYPSLSPNTVKSLPASNLRRITTIETAGYPPVDLFGQEPVHTWCYYYEKADLARQFKQWTEITKLYEEASAKGYDTSASIELMPFIEGYAHTGNFEKAIELTILARDYLRNMSPYLCDNWSRIMKELPPSAQADEAYQIITTEVVGCNQ